jgi:hypothetical protein
MAVPTWSVGQVLSASDVNNWFVPLAAYRTTTQSVTSSITPVNDNALSFSVAANAVYKTELALMYDAATAGDLQWQYTVPASAAITNTFIANLTGAAATFTDDQVIGGVSNPTWGGVGTGTNVAGLAMSVLTTGASSGTLQLQWAQGTSSATSTRVFAGSYLTAQRVG